MTRSTITDAEPLYGFLLKGETATSEGAVIVGTREQVYALGLGDPFPLAYDDQRRKIPLATWLKSEHMEWSEERKRWVGDVEFRAAISEAAARMNPPA